MSWNATFDERNGERSVKVYRTYDERAVSLDEIEYAIRVSSVHSIVLGLLSMLPLFAALGFIIIVGLRVILP